MERKKFMSFLTTSQNFYFILEIILNWLNILMVFKWWFFPWSYSHYSTPLKFLSLWIQIITATLQGITFNLTLRSSKLSEFLLLTPKLSVHINFFSQILTNFYKLYSGTKKFSSSLHKSVRYQLTMEKNFQFFIVAHKLLKIFFLWLSSHTLVKQNVLSLVFIQSWKTGRG